MADVATAPAIPFAVASQFSTRKSFQVAPVTLQAAAPTTTTPIQIPAVGYISSILLDVTITNTGGTTPAFTADGPWNVIQSLSLRNAAGVNLIAPVTGFQLYLMNKYGGQTGFGAAADPKAGVTYVHNPSGTTRFFLEVPIVLDPEEGYGAIAALASNANYQVEMTLAATSVLATGAPTSVVSINATAIYYDLPAASDAQGRAQATMPPSDGVSLWQLEQPTVSPGDAYVQSNTVGNVIRGQIFVLRDSSGARVDASWPDLFELYLDNQPRFSMSKREFERLMVQTFGLYGGTKTANAGTPWASTNNQGSLDAGVYVLPFHALLGSQAGDPGNTRAQLLTTLNATLLQIHAQAFGADASKLEILTNVITTTQPAYLYSK